MTRSVAAKLVAYTGISALFLSAAVAFGQAGFVAASAPFLVALLAGLTTAPRQAPAIRATAGLSSETVVEGTDVTYTVELVSPEGVDKLEVGVAIPEGLVVAEGHLLQAVRLDPGVPTVLEIKLQTPRLGHLPHRTAGRAVQRCRWVLRLARLGGRGRDAAGAVRAGRCCVP